MTTWLKQSTAADVELGPFVDSGDGVTPEESLTISQADCQLIKNGGAAAQKNDATAATHLVSGHYKVPLNTTDTNTLGRLRLLVNEGGAVPVWRDFMVVPANVFDSLVGGSDKLDVNVEEWNATAVPAEHTSGYPIVTVKDGTGTGEIDTASGKVLLQDGAVTAGVIATGAIDADAIADSAIDAGAIATGALTAAKFAAGAIDAAALAADAGTEIGTAVWATAARTLTANTNLNDPTAAAIADAVWDEARSGHTTAGSFGEGAASVQGNVTGSVGSVTGAVGSVTGSVGSVTGAVGSVTGNVGGSVGSVTGAVGSVTGNVGGNVTGSVGSLAAQAKADVNAEVVDALATDTYAELNAVPAATSSLKDKINWLFMLARNTRLTTATADKVRNDANNADIGTSTLSDDGTTFTRGEYA